MALDGVIDGLRDLRVRRWSGVFSRESLVKQGLNPINTGGVCYVFYSD